MEKQQDWFGTACVFLFLSLAFQIHGTSQKHFKTIRRVSGPSLQTTKNDVNQPNLKEKDLIKSLPGQPPVSFKQYGGYVATDESEGRFLYYYFVEANNANKFSPLVIWFNGGPGCSSLSGAYTEHGPFRVHSDGKSLYSNPYSWNNEANMLYVESPSQVGFSYTNTPNPDLEERGKMTAERNYAFLVKWLERFPEYKGREFYITAQSYGGHYGPQLAQIILQRSKQTFINLQGVLIGNPGIDKMEELKGDNEYLLNHALISKELLDNEKRMCDFTNIRPKMYDECGDARAKLENLTKHLNLYSIYAPMCLNSTLTSEPKKYTTVKDFDPCSKNYMTAYLNMPDAQEAMHANTTKLQYPWQQCNKNLSLYWSDDDIDASMIPILSELMGKGVRVWVYSGDADAVVSVTSTLYVLKKMNLKVEKTWRPWFSEGEVGGYTEEYKRNFTFVTVRGGGHSVPSDQPIRALTLFTSFIRNTPLPLL